MRIATLSLLRIMACAACAATSLGMGPAGAQGKFPASTPLADAQHSLNSFAQAWAGLGAYSTTVTAFERKGSDAEKVTLDYSFHKPTDVLIHVLSGRNAGANLRWGGGETVTGWRGGMFGFLKKTFSLHDTSVETTRGSSIDQLSFGAILAHAQREPGKLEAAPPDDVDGVKADVITLSPADPAHDGGLTREIVELSQTTHLPLRVLGYEGAQLVRKVDFSKVTLQD